MILGNALIRVKSGYVDSAFVIQKAASCIVVEVRIVCCYTSADIILAQ